MRFVKRLTENHQENQNFTDKGKSFSVTVIMFFCLNMKFFPELLQFNIAGRNRMQKKGGYIVSSNESLLKRLKLCGREEGILEAWLICSGMDLKEVAVGFRKC